MNILEEIAEKTLERITEKAKEIPLSEVRDIAEKLPVNEDFPFEKALSGGEISFICEVKRASPSKGIIAEDFPYREIARDYENAGAAAISCLTEPFWFKGSDAILREISSDVKIPVLRKDFTVSEYMIYEAKILGASAVLLISSILTEKKLREYLETARGLGLSALVECRGEEEIRAAVSVGARIIGVNNRDLRDFSVDFGKSARLRKLVPEDRIFVAESGVKTAADVKKLREIGADAALIGETLMRAADKTAALRELRGFGED